MFFFEAKSIDMLNANDSVFFALCMLVGMMLLTYLFDFVKTCIKEKKIPLKDKIQQIRKK